MAPARRAAASARQTTIDVRSAPPGKVSSRPATIVSRSILGFALVLSLATAVVSFATHDRAEPGQIVVIPAEREAEIARLASSLNADCEGPNASSSLADAPSAFCLLEQRQSKGDELYPNVPFEVAGVLIGLLWLATGMVIVSRQPRNAAGWVLHVVGSGTILAAVAPTWAFVEIKAAPGSIPAVGMVALVAEYSVGVVGLLPLLWLFYPDGRPPSDRWRWPVRIYVGGVALAVGAAVLSPGPLNNLVDIGVVYLNPAGVASLAGVAGILQAVGVLTALGITAATVVGVRGRYKRAIGDERQRLRWLRFFTTIAIASLAFMFIGGIAIEGLSSSSPAWLENWWPFWFTIAALAIGAGVPASYLIAILRHGLWGLDLVIKKTVQYVVVVAALVLVVTVVMVAIPVLVLGSAVDATLWGSLLLAALLAGGFTWIRGPARRLASRVVYGERASPYEVLSNFGGRLGGAYSADDVLPHMAQLVAEATGARRVDVWLRVGSSLQSEATYPPDAAQAAARVLVDEVPAASNREFLVEVRHQGEQLGAITVEQPPDDPLDPAREALVRDLAAQAGLVLRNAGLLAQLRASRQRLVAAQDEERRKLERNLHDGAQQQLVALALQLKLARSLLDRDPVKAAEMLETTSTVAAEALEDLRDLARGIYPPLLADQGLVAALGSQARKAALPTVVEADGVGRYPQEIEATVYFCALEALNNVAKYAAATRAVIRVAEDGGQVSFTVTDDGRGFDQAETRYGTGLQGMADRLDAVGGGIEVHSAPGKGTSVTGRIPIGPSRSNTALVAAGSLEG